MIPAARQPDVPPDKYIPRHAGAPRRHDQRPESDRRRLDGRIHHHLLLQSRICTHQHIPPDAYVPRDTHPPVRHDDGAGVLAPRIVFARDDQVARNPRICIDQHVPPDIYVPRDTHPPVRHDDGTGSLAPRIVYARDDQVARDPRIAIYPHISAHDHVAGHTDPSARHHNGSPAQFGRIDARSDVNIAPRIDIAPQTDSPRHHDRTLAVTRRIGRIVDTVQLQVAIDIDIGLQRHVLFHLEGPHNDGISPHKDITPEGSASPHRQCPVAPRIRYTFAGTVDHDVAT